MLLFSLDSDPATGSDPAFGGRLAAELGLDAPAPHEDHPFEDGECRLRPLVDPQGEDVYVVHGLHGDGQASPHDRLCRLLFFIATLNDLGAARVTAVVPYLAYARKERRTRPWDPLALRYLAQLFEAVGTGQVMVLEAHDVGAFQNAFRCPTVHLSAHESEAFIAAARELAGDAPVAVASPDPGGVKRAQLWREALEPALGRPVGFAMIDKRRGSDETLSGGRLVTGEVAGATVLLVDDLIASGETLRRGAVALRAAGAAQVFGCAAHGLFVGDAGRSLADPALSGLMVSDSVPPSRLAWDGAVRTRLRVASAAPLFAQAIRASHEAWRR